MQTGGSNFLSDDFEYVMHGRIFKIEQAKDGPGKAQVFISFGGLLMQLTGDASRLSALHIDENVFLLMRSTQ